MWYLLLLLCICYVLYASVFVRVLVAHPLKTVYYGVQDVYHYFKYHTYDIYDGGVLNCYFAHFGGGKTLSMVHYVSALYKRYNNKRVWDRGRQKFVLQKVHVISNVHLSGIPYEELISLSQVVCCAYRNKQIDESKDTRTIVLVLLDEASSQLNSRAFKTNIDSDFLNTLITSRHFNMSLYYTSQKFKLVDALLRSVTQRCIWCDKHWRVMVQHVYDADELEYTSNPTLVQPVLRTGFFIANRDYNAYDTLATVSKLKKAVDDNEMMSESEILALRGAINPDNDNISKPSRRLRQLRRRR